MRRAHQTEVLCLLAVSAGVATAIAGCAAGHTGTGGNGASPSASSSSGHAGTGGTGGAPTSSSTIASSSSSGVGGLGLGGSGPSGCPHTCAELGATCGTITDTQCNDAVVTCPACPSGQICGSGSVHNQCVPAMMTSPDAGDGCSPLTCADQSITCGPAGDGCGGTIASCGTCMPPQICGGDPSKPGQCSCTGTCSQVPTCTAPATTTITGTVYDPAGNHPLYNALVYIPNDTTDPGLLPFAAGITCDICGATAAGSPLISTKTDAKGNFTLTGAPAGSAIPVVIQLGRWRRQFKLSVPTLCGANSVGMLTMPKNHGEGDIPRIAMLTGGFDPVECVLRKMGVDDTEFTDPGQGGHINFYTATHTECTQNLLYNGVGSGATISSATPTQPALFAMNGTTPVINQYDMVYLQCTGCMEKQTASDQAAIHAYAEAGGRVFASDWMSSFLDQNGNFASAATWQAQGTNAAGPTGPITIDLASNPEGKGFDAWLENVGVSVPGSDAIASIAPTYHNTTALVAPTQQWLYGGSPAEAIHFTFNVPISAPAANQCGRVIFSDWHADANLNSNMKTFPAECDSAPMTAQEAILEFMLFDATACVPPLKQLCTPRTCASQGIACGTANDGCGNGLDCGACTAPATCGGGGQHGQCGVSMTGTPPCVPETCMSQNIACGPAGDGCGGTLQCGNCPTGQICGLNAPGQCSAPVK